MHVQFVYYVFDDDQDNDVVRGLKATVLRNVGDPVSPLIELERIPNQIDYVDWENISTSRLVEIGVFDYDGPREKYLNRLMPVFDDNYKMARFGRYED